MVLLAGCQDMELRPGARSLTEALKPTTPLEAAQMALDPFDADRRYRGTLLLARARFANEPVYLELFEDHAADPDPAVRAAALGALSANAPPDKAGVLIKALDDEDPQVRREAALGLQRLHHRDAVGPLIQRLDAEHEPDAQVRAEAAQTLGQFAEPRVLQALIAALDDPQLAVDRNAAQSLRTLTGQDFGMSRAAWARWAEDAGRPFAAQAVYMYPGYERSRRWFEYVPFVPRPVTEVPGVPRGLALPHS
jgi:HEAT repeat protein